MSAIKQDENTHFSHDSFYWVQAQIYSRFPPQVIKLIWMQSLYSYDHDGFALVPSENRKKLSAQKEINKIKCLTKIIKCKGPGVSSCIRVQLSFIATTRQSDRRMNDIFIFLGIIVVFPPFWSRNCWCFSMNLPNILWFFPIIHLFLCPFFPLNVENLLT